MAVPLPFGKIRFWTFITGAIALFFIVGLLHSVFS